MSKYVLSRLLATALLWPGQSLNCDQHSQVDRIHSIGNRVFSRKQRRVMRRLHAPRLSSSKPHSGTMKILTQWNTVNLAADFPSMAPPYEVAIARFIRQVSLATTSCEACGGGPDDELKYNYQRYVACTMLSHSLFDNIS